MSNMPKIVDESGDKYKFGFVTDIDSEVAPKGLNEDIIRLISAKKEEPEWLLESRLKAYRKWLTMTEPTWAKVTCNNINPDSQFYRMLLSPKMADND